MKEIEVSSMLLNKKTAVISIAGNITDYFVTRLISEFGCFGSTTTVQDITLMLSSDGGFIGHITNFHDIFKPMGLKRIVAYGSLCSAALALGLDARSKGVEFFIDPSCYVMLHRCFCETSEARPEMIKNFATEHLEKVDKLFTKMNAPLIDVLNKRRKDIYHSGGNNYFTGQDLVDYGIADKFEGLEPFIVKPARRKRRTPSKK